MSGNKTNTQAAYPLKENQQAQLVIKIKSASVLSLTFVCL